jgi:hypothetical protein
VRAGVSAVRARAHRARSSTRGPVTPALGRGLDRLQVPGELRALVAQCGQQRQPAVREPGQGGLAAAAGQVEGLGGAGGERVPVAGGHVAARTPGERVDDQRECPGLAGVGEQPRVVSLHITVVAEVKGGDAQVGAEVGVLTGVAVRQGRAKLRCCLGELPVSDVHEPGQQPGVAARAVAGRRGNVAERRGLRGHVVGALADEGGEGGGDHRHRPGTLGVNRSHVAGGLQQDPVADQGRADVPVHAGAQPIQVGAQQRVGGIRTGRVGQGAGAGRLRRVARRVRGGGQPPGPARRVGGELGCA